MTDYENAFDHWSVGSRSGWYNNTGIKTQNPIPPVKPRPQFGPKCRHEHDITDAEHLGLSNITLEKGKHLIKRYGVGRTMCQAGHNSSECKQHSQKFTPLHLRQHRRPKHDGLNAKQRRSLRRAGITLD